MEKIRVLLIEDNPADADFIREILSTETNPSFALEPVPRLKPALERLAQGGIDIVLSDLSLPDSRGLETFKRVLACSPLVPIVILSGMEDESAALEAVHGGAQDYLVKGSVDGKLLSRVMRYAIERKRVEKALARLASFPELDPNPVFEADFSGKITYANPAARAQFEGLGAAGPKHPLLEDLENLEVRLREAREGFVREVGIEGRVLEQHFSSVPGGNLFRSYVLDVTGRKELEKLKDEFVSTVSHELRTPLSLIKEGIRIVLDGIPGPVNEGQKKILSISRRNADRLVRIINNLLDMSKLEAGRVALKKERLEIAEMIRQTIVNFEGVAAEKKLRLKADVPEEKPLAVSADPDKLTQIFTNLVGNAMKFTPADGSITLSAREREQWVECAVSDTGAGIEQENLPKVFGRFQQFGRAPGQGEKGTGLGLAITKGLVELHGGMIWVESEAGKGTTFRFTLPRPALEEAPPRASAQKQGAG